MRVVAATNRDLEAEVARGAFRADLYYRLNVIELQLPPLRQRREDIPLLAEHFLRRFGGEHGRERRGCRAEAMRQLERYDFPGNVRELENIIERAVALIVEPADRRERPARRARRRARRSSCRAELPDRGRRPRARWSATTSASWVTRRSSRPAASASAPPSCSASASARCATGSRSSASTAAATKSPSSRGSENAKRRSRRRVHIPQSARRISPSSAAARSSSPAALPLGAVMLSVYVIFVPSQSRSPTAVAFGVVALPVYVYSNRFGSSIWKSSAAQPESPAHAVGRRRYLQSRHRRRQRSRR